MPGNYDAEKRTITLESEFQSEPELTVATLVNFIMRDFLTQQGFQFSQLPEAVDVAVVACGLGMPQGQLSMVNDSGNFWDPTAWEIGAKPFLDTQSIAYAFALASRVRHESAPTWFVDLPNAVAGPMKKSIKYLSKTNDCFFDLDTVTTEMTLKGLVDRATPGSKTVGNSTTIVAMKHFQPDESLLPKMESVVENSLRGVNRDVVLHAINAASEIKSFAANVVDELKLNCESSDDLVRAKSMAAIGQLGKLDSDTVPLAAKMLDSKTDFVVFSGLTALMSQPAVDDSVITATDRGFKRALQTCNYQFVGLFAAAYRLWLEDPHQHFYDLLAEDSPEYLQIAINALDENKEQFVGIGSE